MEGSVAVTGFCSFGDVRANPTELIVEHLRRNCPSEYALLEVIDVSVTAVEDFVARNTSLYSHGEKSLILHLGVNAGAKRFHIEECAYNNKTFRIPDNLGYNPTNECISSSHALDACLMTNIPVEAMLGQLGSGDGSLVCRSNDPGRYICNYIYYRSLTQASSCGGRAEVVFLHTPPIEVCSVDEQIEFVRRFVAAWWKVNHVSA